MSKFMLSILLFKCHFLCLNCTFNHQIEVSLPCFQSQLVFVTGNTFLVYSLNPINHCKTWHFLEVFFFVIWNGALISMITWWYIVSSVILLFIFPYQTIFGEVIPLQCNTDVYGLSHFIITRLVTSSDLAQEYAHPTVPHLYRDGRLM